ncbi:uncharacterized protein F4822DRAFT_410455 [Hypoxylon trugodes]|uniref:uncharacterized protein n=1 Tax=Hypoxylon trugodes TaxID=326681 RepID=UPI0021A09B29|nr:uncharacterized protein F4822DRAFT_410455 [Hypoxylon trugodes]KAI1386554.1 hypothetical protein F4822DRAFT_410455 [Hypoxylon trugodes]
MSDPPAAINFGTNVCLFRCLRSDGEKFPEERYRDCEWARPEKVEDWLTKLGKFARHQFYPLEANFPSDREFAFESFPKNYELRTRKKSTDGAPYCYLFGHPEREDANKAFLPPVFRSPAEFFPHLLWLVTDENLDRATCQCRCCIEQLQLPKTQNAKGSSLASSGPPPDPSAGSGGPPGPTTRPSKPSSRSSAKKGGSTASSANKPTSKSTTVDVQPQIDESFLFREGEVVWFRKIQEAFRLGIILRNFPGDPASSTPPKSRIQPLSHHQRVIEDVERAEVDMRPFLTFSVPAINPMLHAIADQPMQSVAWDLVEAQLPNENMKGEMLSLDASKIAASQIDHSYSLFNAIANPHAPPNQVNFGGVFLGCEKLGVFEAVRVRVELHEHPDANNLELTFAMVLKSIVLEKTDKAELLYFQGDIWLLQETSSPQHVQNLDQLPLAMRREKAFRDNVKRAHGTHFDWVPVLMNIIKPEQSIRGRFYESERLGPMLNPQWGQYLQTGVVLNIQKSLNNRFDSRGNYIGRKKSRLAAIIGAVPPNTTLSLGPGVVEWS